MRTYFDPLKNGLILCIYRISKEEEEQSGKDPRVEDDLFATLFKVKKLLKKKERKNETTKQKVNMCVCVSKREQCIFCSFLVFSSRQKKNNHQIKITV